MISVLNVYHAKNTEKRQVNQDVTVLYFHSLPQIYLEKNISVIMFRQN